MLTIAFDSNGDLIGDPIDLSMPIDLNGANSVAVSITPCSIDLDGATSIELSFATAAINAKGFFAAVKASGSTVSMSFTTAVPDFQFGENLSRFFTLVPTITGGPPATMATLVCTIDIVVR